MTEHVPRSTKGSTGNVVGLSLSTEVNDAASLIRFFSQVAGQALFKSEVCSQPGMQAPAALLASTSSCRRPSMNNPHVAAAKFAADFGAMEYALKRTSKYRRRNRAIAEVDWDAFASDLGQEFFDHILESGIAKTLVGEPPRRLLANMQWDPPNPAPLSNVVQLIVNGVCRVRNSYLHGEKFTGGPDGQWGRDAKLVEEAHAVLKEAQKFAFS